VDEARGAWTAEDGVDATNLTDVCADVDGEGECSQWSHLPRNAPLRGRGSREDDEKHMSQKVDFVIALSLLVTAGRF
jgi:hypothetical protein